MSEFILDCIVRKIEEKEKDNFNRFRADRFKFASRHEPVDIIPMLENGFFIIAEVKKGSPSRGILREDFRPVDIALSYCNAGASAISVITEQNYFYGCKHDLAQVKKNVDMPVLRKDFIIHPFQVYESFSLGADIVLLIAACLSDERLAGLYRIILSLGMEALIEVHTEEELRRVLKINPRLIGINNRNLKTFDVDIETSFRLREKIPVYAGIIKPFVISESGISGPDDIKRLKDADFNGVLIGEFLLKQNDSGAALKDLLNENLKGSSYED